MPLLRSFLNAFALALACTQVAAQASWPTRPVRIVVPFPAGGATDVAARAIANQMATTLGQPVIVENKAGASGKIGTDFVVANASDDHLLLMTNPSSHTLPGLIERRPSFDPVRDFRPVAQVASATMFLAVSSAVPVQSFQEFVALARRSPGKLSYGSIGNGSAQHLFSELLKKRVGISMVHIPYRGEMPAVNDLLAGTIDVYFLASAKRFENEPRVKLLAVAANERWFNLPQIPTMAEQGLDKFTFDAWNGLFATRAMPADAVARLNGAVNAALKSQGVRDALQTLGYRPVGGAPDVLAQRVSADINTYRPLVDAKVVQLND